MSRNIADIFEQCDFTARFWRELSSTRVHRTTSNCDLLLLRGELYEGSSIREALSLRESVALERESRPVALERECIAL